MGRQRRRRPDRTTPSDPPVGVPTGVGVVRVADDPARPRVSLLAIDQHVHGAVDTGDPTHLALGYLDRLGRLVEVLRPDTDGDPGTIVHLGGGAFALPRALLARARAAGRPVDTQLIMERSKAVIRVAREQLGLRDQPDLIVRSGDARTGIERLGERQALMVVGDAFVGLETPRQLATVEFLDHVRRVLVPGGVYVVNLVDQPPYPVVAAQAATARQVFSTVFVVADRGVANLKDPGNAFLVATDRDIALGELGHRLAVGTHPSAVVRPGRLATLAASARPRHDTD